MAGTVLHGMWRGVVQVAAQQPWVIVLVGLIVLARLVHAARIAMHTGRRDELRLFPPREKKLLLRYAGQQCEYQGWIGDRCKAVERLEADHVHPHSRGGPTHLRNGQILCRSHNRAKKASIPWDRSLRKLADHRAAYYPAGVDPMPLRHRPKQDTVADRRPDLAWIEIGQVPQNVR